MLVIFEEVECRWSRKDGHTWRSRTDGHKFFGVRVPKQRNGHISLCAIRQPRRCQANRNSGERWRIGVSQPQQRTAAKALQSALAAFPRTTTPELESKWQARAATQANRAPAPEATFEAARVRVSKLEAAIEPASNGRNNSSTVRRSESRIWTELEKRSPRSDALPRHPIFRISSGGSTKRTS